MTRRLLLLGLPALTAFSLFACSQNNGKTVPPTQAQQGLTNAPVIEARDFSFAPNQIQVAPGAEKLTLRNTGSQKHAFELYKDEQYQKPVSNARIDSVDPGQSAAVSFELPNEAATYYFRCEFHPERMHGQAKIAGS